MVGRCARWKSQWKRRAERPGNCDRGSGRRTDGLQVRPNEPFAARWRAAYGARGPAGLTDCRVGSCCRKPFLSLEIRSHFETCCLRVLLLIMLPLSLKGVFSAASLSASSVLPVSPMARRPLLCRRCPVEPKVQSELQRSPCRCCRPRFARIAAL